MKMLEPALAILTVPSWQCRMTAKAEAHLYSELGLYKNEGWTVINCMQLCSTSSGCELNGSEQVMHVILSQALHRTSSFQTEVCLHANTRC